MSSGPRPRTLIHFPRMKVRGYRRRARAVELRYQHFRPRYFLSVVHDFVPVRSRVAEAMAEMNDTARKMAEKTRLPTLWYRP